MKSGILASIIAAILSLFGIPHAPSQTAAVAVAAAPAPAAYTEPITSPSGATTSVTVPPAAPAPTAPQVIQRIVETPAAQASGVSPLILATLLADFQQKVDAKLAAAAPQQTAAAAFSGGGAGIPAYVQNWGLSQKIDQLANTAVSNPTITGGSISNTSISGYLPTTGGTLTGDLSGTNLTLSGALTAGALNVSSIASAGALTGPYFTATDTAATSTLAGGLAVSGYLTLGTTTVQEPSQILYAGVNRKTIQRFDIRNWNAGTLARSGFIARGDTATGVLDVFSSNNTQGIGIGSITAPNLVRFSAINASTFLIDTFGATTPIVFANGSGERLRIDSTGNIGIGTTTPWGRLSITGSGTGATPDFVFADSNNNPKFVIQDNGNVGVGTTSPSYKFDIVGANNLPQLVVRASISQTAANPIIDVLSSTGSELFGLSSDDNRNLFAGFSSGRANTITGVGYEGQANTFIGSYSGAINSTGYHNTATGAYSLMANTSGYQNTAVGYYALTANTTGIQNTGLGNGALDANLTGNYNVGIGHHVLTVATSSSFNAAVGAFAMTLATSLNKSAALGYAAMAGAPATGASNDAIGFQSLYSVTSGDDNNAIGANSLYANTSGSFNSAIGSNSLASNTLGSFNTVDGYNVAQFNTTGSSNAISGAYALRFNTSGSNNAAMGYQALYNNAVANNAVAFGTYASYGAAAYSNQGGTTIGYQSGYNFATGSDYNTLLGFQSGYGITTGSRNVLLGHSTIAASYNQVTTGSNNIAIGNDVAVPDATASNQLVIGNLIYGTGLNGTGSTVSTGNVGIGTTSPQTRLHIFGSNTTPLIVDTASTQSFTKFQVSGLTKGYVGYSSTGGGGMSFANSVGTATLFATDAGNVGIGTTSPTTALQVAGVITPNQDNTSSLGNSAYRWSAVYAANGTIQTSDQRLKSNITDLSYGLSDILKLRPVSFVWKSHPEQGTKLGFIAQEVQQVMPETVTVGDDANHTMGLTYTEFIPAIVKAIQQLAAKLDSLATTVSNFAESFTTHNLCVTKSDGSPVCVTGDQLAAPLAAAGQHPVAPTATTSPLSAASSTLIDLIASTTPVIVGAPEISINGANPATIQIGSAYNDLGATITGPQQDLNLGIHTFVNGVAMDQVTIDTATTSTSTIDYVVTDQFGTTATATRTVIVAPAHAVNPFNMILPDSTTTSATADGNASSTTTLLVN